MCTACLREIFIRKRHIVPITCIICNREHKFHVDGSYHAAHIGSKQPLTDFSLFTETEHDEYQIDHDEGHSEDFDILSMAIHQSGVTAR